MMPEDQFQNTRENSSCEAIAAPESAMRTQIKQLILESEISVVTSRLNDIADYKRDPGGKLNSYVDGLIRRRAGLLKQPRPKPAPVTDVRANAIVSLVANIGPFFSPWITVNLPYMSEGINETPGIAGTSGAITTAGLYPGGLAYTVVDATDDNTTSPFIEKWWIHNWTCSFVFPEAPFDGYLFYRFTTDSSCFLYSAPADFGLIKEFVTVGKTSDVNAQSPFDPSTCETVGYNVSTTLPHPESRLLGASVPVLGSINVQRGKTPALGLIYGTIIGLADGYAYISWANFGTRLTLPPGTPFDGEVYDKIEYRFEADWWVQAVSNRLPLASRAERQAAIEGGRGPR